MANIDTRSSFFPNTKPKSGGQAKPVVNVPLADKTTLGGIGKKPTNNDSKVDIDDTIKDFSKIKMAVDKAPPMDNSDKIAALKEQVKNGTYKIDYDSLADSIMQSEY